MVLLQFTLSYDDLLNNGSFPNSGICLQPVVAGTPSFSNAGILLRPVNLYGGRYKCKLAGFDVFSGGVNTTTYEMNPQIIHISSSKWVFPAQASKSLSFTNNGYNSLPVLGCREFEMDVAGASIDISLQITQFGQNINANVNAVTGPFTVDKTATWTSALFSYAILSLEVEEIPKKALFGNV